MELKLSIESIILLRTKETFQFNYSYKYFLQEKDFIMYSELSYLKIQRSYFLSAIKFPERATVI